ncbi:hypothetical protein ZHAS_00006770 [Anopheles sinensis]|uniref:Uncharacterized protein n=1 Tax=Anopheles sinensis TaxID=74873 RepID=A0A084VN05_ANOSI|nr:hypothetical protein ZHAS_00006770 [Anopheles sinensis]
MVCAHAARVTGYFSGTRSDVPPFTSTLCHPPHWKDWFANSKPGYTLEVENDADSVLVNAPHGEERRLYVCKTKMQSILKTYQVFYPQPRPK